MYPNVAGSKDSSEAEGLFENPAKLGIFWIDEDVKKETLKAMKEDKAFKSVTIIDKTFKENNYKIGSLK